MGKRLIIKNADFSANAVYPGVSWIDKSLAKPYIVTNPSSNNFGKSGAYNSATGSVYMYTLRAIGTIAVLDGEKIIVEIVNSTNTIQRINPSVLRYPSSWEGSGTNYVVPVSIPSGESNDYSIYYNTSVDAPIMQRFEWVNNTGGTAHFMFQFNLEEKTNISETDYTMKYAIIGG